MKLHYAKTRLPFYFLSFLMVIFLISCGTAQNVTSNEDGIYSNETEEPRRKVVIANEREYEEYNDNYFTKEIERIDKLNGTDILTDIDNYKSYGEDDEEVIEIIEDETPRTRISYNEGWGSNDDTDVVININTFPRYGYGFYNDFYWNDFYGYGYGYGFNRPWRFRTRWGWNPYWHPYHASTYWGNGFYTGIGFYGNPYYCPPYYAGGYYSPYWRNSRHYYRGGNPYRGRYSVAANTRNVSRRAVTNSNRRSTTYRNSRNRRSTRPTTSTRSRRTIRNYDRNGRLTTSRTRPSTTRPNNNIRGYVSNRNKPTTTRPNNNIRGYVSNKTKPVRTVRKKYRDNRPVRTARSTRSTRNNRSYTPRRSNSSRYSQSTRSRSTRSYTPSRSSSRSRSYTPSRSSSSRSFSGGRSSSRSTRGRR